MLREFWSGNNVQVGSKLPTEHELVARYKVSRPTISKAIASLAAEGWVTKRQGSGIYVAAVSKPSVAMSNRQQPRIGYVTMSMQPVLSHRIFEGIEQVARQQNHVVEVASTNWVYESERREIAAMRERGVHGVVLYAMPRRPETDEYLAKEFRDFPIVVVDLYQTAMKRPHFIFDNYEAGREMTQSLLDQGRRKIAFLKFSDALSSRSVDDRLLGYRRALEDAGEPFVTERIIAFDGNAPLSKGHREALEKFVELKPRPTALITPSDPYAYATIAYLRQQGVAVPADVLVVGFDNLRDEPWWERFPTTQPDFVRMGERATEMLLERIASRNFEPTEVVLPCPLVRMEESQATEHGGTAVILAGMDK